MLPYDITRCAGIGNQTVCERRNACARYIAAVRGEFGPRTPCSSFLCQDGQDSFIEYVGEAMKSG